MVEAALATSEENEQWKNTTDGTPVQACCMPKERWSWMKKYGTGMWRWR